MRAYPAKLTPAEEGGFNVSFRDVPEALTFGDTLDEALAHGANALETGLSFYVDDRKPLPVLSPAKRGEHMVELSAVAMARQRCTKL